MLTLLGGVCILAWARTLLFSSQQQLVNTFTRSLALIPLIGLICGIACSAEAAALGGLTVSTVMIITLIWKHSYKAMAVFLMCMAVGYARIKFIEHELTTKRLAFASPIDIKGCILDKKKKRRFLYRYTIMTSTYKKADVSHYEPFNGYLELESSANLLVGDDVVLKNIDAHISTKPGSFSDYLNKNNTIAYLRGHDVEDIWVVKRPVSSWQKSIQQARGDIMWACKKGMSWLTRNFFGLLFLGSKEEPLNDQLNYIFNLWGLVHYLARSGLHIVIIIGLGWQFLRPIPLPLLLKEMLLFSFIVLYDLLSFSSLSFARAYYAYLFARASLFLTGFTNAAHCFLLVTFFTLWLAPHTLFALDFQLSYGMTATLFVLAKLF